MPRRGTKRRKTENNLLTIYHGIDEEVDSVFGVDTAGYLYRMILPGGKVVEETPDSLRLSTNGDEWFVSLAGNTTNEYEIFNTPEEAFEYIKDDEVWLRSLKEFQELVDNSKEWMAVARKHRPRIYVPRYDYEDDDDLVVAI